MKYFAQREHALKSLSSLLFNLYIISYLLFPSFSLLATRWAVQTFWLALQKEVLRYKLRWTLIPLGVFALATFIHIATSPSVSIILDFIGNLKPPRISFILALDLFVLSLELITSAFLYSHCISFVHAHEDRRRNNQTSKRTSSTRSRREKIILEMSLHEFWVLIWDPRSTLTPATDPPATSVEEPARQNEDATRLLTALSNDGEPRMGGIPLPFNLRPQTRPPRGAARATNTMPGSLLRDW
ncbi:hypothetical protein FRC19_010053 [Serendipita sp. 401]|nr:hypothetical protein FRC19_010053 [Serendipita sp. 401]KAG9056888.1 hypothetical protein FS842_009249 [Serendipita sp. 407]